VFFFVLFQLCASLENYLQNNYKVRVAMASG
jgi:hypothetical protein